MSDHVCEPPEARIVRLEERVTSLNRQLDERVTALDRLLHVHLAARDDQIARAKASVEALRVAQEQTTGRTIGYLIAAITMILAAAAVGVSIWRHGAQ